MLISSARPSLALITKSASAKNGRAMETISASPLAKTCSAISGVLIRLDVTTGTENSSRNFAVTHVNAALGTLVAMVGIFASCQPMPVLIIVAPAFSTALPSCMTSSALLPPSTRSSIESRNIIIKCSPTASRTCRTTSMGRRILFS